MNKLKVGGLRYVAQRVGAIPMLAAALTIAAGCAQPVGGSAGPGDGGGGATSGIGGGTSTAKTTTSTSTTTSHSTTTTTTTGNGGEGGAYSSGATYAAGSGGGGGGAPYVAPTGTADYPLEIEQNGLKSNANPLADGTKGFTASLYPTGDVDVFSFTVTTAGSSVRIATSDGNGSCPAGAETFIRLLSPTGVSLATDTDSGYGGFCSLISPTYNAGAENLTAGTYYVEVDSATGGTIPFYVVEIAVTAPRCGDHEVQIAAGEQCDDGANVDGDGCSATCKLEGNYTTEVEPNDTSATANTLDGFDGAVGALVPDDDSDYYVFNVTVPGSSVVLSVEDGSGGCPADLDTELSLTDSSGNELAYDDDGGTLGCSRIGPDAYQGAANLPVGTYYVKIDELDGYAEPFYVFKIKVTPPGCGDLVLQSGEQCDDGNVVNGDGCSSTCQYEGNLLPETEPNGTRATGNPLGTADGFYGTLTPANDIDYFTFTVATAGSSVNIAVTNGGSGCPAGLATQIDLYGPTNTKLATDYDSGPGDCSLISPVTVTKARNLPTGTYAVRLQNDGSTAATSYVLKIHVSPPGCGDGVLATGEQCDDGNATNGDGCSAMCMAEAPYEVEPNGTKATATPLWPNTSRWLGAVSPVGDHDYFTFTLTAATSNVTLFAHNADGTPYCDFDSLLHLLDANGVEIAQDEYSSDDYCSKISSADYPAVSHLAAGVYYVWMQEASDYDTIESYQIDLTIK